MTSLEDNFNISLEQIKNTFTVINTIAIQYAMKILLTKRKLENNQMLPNFLDNTKNAFNPLDDRGLLWFLSMVTLVRLLVT